MVKLEDLRPNAPIEGIAANRLATVVSARLFGSESLESTDKAHRVEYLRQPLRQGPEDGVTSVNHKCDELLARAKPPLVWLGAGNIE